jgi:outer membrane scaffolding protein for murein synthesis (MipA/OmpV family)
MTLAFLNNRTLFGIVKATIFVAALTATSAHSAEFANSGWMMTVSGKTIATPSFPGSDRYSFVSFPEISVEAPNMADHLVGRDESLSLVLFSPDPSLGFGAVGRYDPLKADQNSFSGNDKRWAVEPGVFAEYWPAPDALRIRGEIRLGTDGIAGMTGTIGADYVQRIGKFVIAAGPHVAMSGSDYANAQFGSDFSNLGTAGGSIDARSFGASGLVKFAIGQNWSTSVFANYDRVVVSNISANSGKLPAVNDEVRVGASFNINLTPPLR